jgi:hypothetical protein
MVISATAVIVGLGITVKTIVSLEGVQLVLVNVNVYVPTAFGVNIFPLSIEAGAPDHVPPDGRVILPP